MDLNIFIVAHTFYHSRLNLYLIFYFLYTKQDKLKRTRERVIVKERERESLERLKTF